MLVKNVNELKMNFPVTYLGQTYIIRYGEIRELPDGAVDMRGIPGWLICRPSPVAPKIVEIDFLSVTNPKLYEVKNALTEEQKEEIKKTLEDSRQETLKITEENRRRKEAEQLEGINHKNNSQDSSTIPTIEEFSDVNSMEDLMSPTIPEEKQSEVLEEMRKPELPLKGKHVKKIPKHVANRGIKSRIDQKKTLRLSKDSNSGDL
jgi:hypothetical protein